MSVDRTLSGFFTQNSRNGVSSVETPSGAAFRCVPPNYTPVTDVCVECNTTNRCISASRLARNNILTATSMFSGSNFSMVLSVTLSDETEVRNQRWRLK